ncbi:c-type cytochrome [Azospirillum sp.]|uniref:c-type cytochrome n=1 Tax=Azospirillum sp. TaxID=34012 RepID=UPI003D7282A7
MRVRPPSRPAVRLATAGLLLALWPAFAQAGDPQAGRRKAGQCQTCHGLDGVAKIPQAPNLAGQQELYLKKALTDYKTGARRNEMMSLVAPALSEQDIDDLAAYYAAIPVEVKAPP